MLTTMDYQKSMQALKRLRVETGSLACFGCGHEHNCSTQGCAILRNAVGHMEAALERATLTPPNEWVSVEERLPEKNAQVLMWSAKWNIAEAGSYYNGRFWVYSEIGDAYIADDITHWMPLPAPPEKEKE